MLWIRSQHRNARWRGEYQEGIKGNFYFAKFLQQDLLKFHFQTAFKNFGATHQPGDVFIIL
jgi:hypothetical protein